MNELVQFETGKLAQLQDPAMIERMQKNAQQVAGNLNTGSDGTPLLRFTQEGEWVVGQENQPVPHDFQFALDPFAIAAGWVCWKGQRPIDMAMVPVLEGQPVAEDSLPDHRPYKGGMEGWKASVEFVAHGLTTALKCRFNNNSMGAQRMVNKLIGAVIVQLNIDAGHPVPVVVLHGESYYNKNYSKDIFNPLLSVVGWADAEMKVSPISEVLPPAAADDGDGLA